MRKEQYVQRLNELLDLEHRLTVWQFLQVRKFELEEMSEKIEDLYYSAHGYSLDEAPSRSAVNEGRTYRVKRNRKY